jgi:transcriptional regulator with XRE-family HTH domain
VPKPSNALTEIPPALRSVLRELGANLAIARKRRKESIRAWAGRIGVSEPTLVRMEKGDPSVAFGTYATALWMIGRAPAIAQLAAPQLDLGALEHEVRIAHARSARTATALTTLPVGAADGQAGLHAASGSTKPTDSVDQSRG